LALRSSGPPSEAALQGVGALFLGATAIATSAVLLLTMVSGQTLSVASAVCAVILLVSGIGCAKCVRKIRAFHRHDGWLELHEDRIQLVGLDGSPRADTLTRTLTITRINHERRGKWKSSLQPSFRVRSSSGNWLLGTYPRSAWDDAPRTQDLPGDTLASDDFGALEDAVRRCQ
jgi:hypothetical protein